MVGKLGTTEWWLFRLAIALFLSAMSIGIGFSTAITPLIAEADAAQNQGALQKFYKRVFASV